jgi:hypothetical protein
MLCFRSSCFALPTDFSVQALRTTTYFDLHGIHFPRRLEQIKRHSDKTVNFVFIGLLGCTQRRQLKILRDTAYFFQFCFLNKPRAYKQIRTDSEGATSVWLNVRLGRSMNRRNKRCSSVRNFSWISLVVLWRLFYVLPTNRLQSPVFGSSPCRPFRLFRFARFRACGDASHSLLTFGPLFHILA